MANRKSKSDKGGDGPESEPRLGPDGLPILGPEDGAPEAGSSDPVTPPDPAGLSAGERRPTDPLDAGPVDPRAGDPVASDPLSAESPATDPLATDPLATDPAARGATERGIDASGSDPAAGGKIAPEEMAPLDADRVGSDLGAPDPETRSEPGGTASGETAGERPEGVPAEPLADPLAGPTLGTEADARGERAAGADTARGEPATAAGSAEADHHDEPDEGGRSLAATLLIGLLLLIAGAALGLWAAPRVAPHLPAGMAPVAAWLTPGAGQAENRIAALEAETSAAIAELRAEIDAVAAEETTDTAGLEARIADIEAALGRLDAFEQDLGALDGAETRDRISRLEAAVEGQQDTLANLRDQLAQVDAIEGAAVDLDAYQAELSGLRGEIRDVAGQVGGLSRRIDEVAAQADQQVELARAQVEEIEAEAAASLSRAEVDAALAEIRSALAAGMPYDDAVARLGERPDIAVPQGLAEPAPDGVPTLASLRQGFPDAATSAIRADIQARSDDGLLGRMRGFAEAQVATRSLEPRPGVDTDSVLSRVEDALRRDDLETALAEAEDLPPEAAEAMSGWLAAARTRAEAEQGYEQLQAELSAIN